MKNPSSERTKSPDLLVLTLAIVALVAFVASLMLPALAKPKAKAQRTSAAYRLALLETTSLEQAGPEFNTESYDHVRDNPFLSTRANPLSTFSIDVDTASFANVRRFLNEGHLPPKDAVRIEELLNYFTYNHPAPMDEHPLAARVEFGDCPWNRDHRLAMFGIKGKEIPPQPRPDCNLVFLIDVSGSMEPDNKLPLLVRALELLVEQLSGKDRVAIVVYAGSSGLILDSTSGANKKAIVAALKRLQAGGSTNGGAGIQQAYEVAVQNFIEGGANRVILCTDGDFNVGVSSTGDLVRLIKEKARSGVFLRVLGFGMGNYKDSTLEKLADLGNGNYGYIDTIAEAKKMLVEQLTGTLVTIAKDVKLQVEFNPQHVSAYRLIGYENRVLRSQEFNDDKRDAGDLGSGHTVTALYELVPADKKDPSLPIDPLKYQRTEAVAETVNETTAIKIRYKLPNEEGSKLMTFAATDTRANQATASKDFKIAAAVAAFGMVLRDSEYKGTATYNLAEELAADVKPANKHGQEFLDLVRLAAKLGSPHADAQR